MCSDAGWLSGFTFSFATKMGHVLRHDDTNKACKQNLKALVHSDFRIQDVFFFRVLNALMK